MKYIIFVLALVFLGCQSVPQSSEFSYNQREMNPKKGTSCLPKAEFEKQVSYSYRPNLCQ